MILYRVAKKNEHIVQIYQTTNIVYVTEISSAFKLDCT